MHCKRSGTARSDDLLWLAVICLLLSATIAPVCAREPAPDFELRGADGKKLKLSDFKGQVVLLNFWATWCPPCRAEVPWLNEIHAEYKANGFSVVGVAMDEQGWRSVKPFLAQYSVKYPVLLGNARVARLYGGLDVLPRTLFLDRAGEVVAEHNAILGKDSLRKVVETLLAERPKSE